MSKQYKVKVWDIKFYKVDEDGDALLNDDGSVKLFSQTRDIDLSWVSDSVTENNLKEDSTFNNARASIKFLLSFCHEYEIRGIDPFMLEDVHEEILHMENES